MMKQKNNRLQRSGTFLTALFLACGILPGLAAAVSFPDVSEKTVNFNAVEYLKAKGIVSGYPDGTFQPDKTINRAEAVKMVLLASATPLESNELLGFPDVSSGDWFFQYVRAAVTADIIEGYPDGSFKPANNINVAESLKIILLSFKVTLGTPPSTKPYPDVDADTWYAHYADYGKLKQLIWPLDDGLLHADRDITRGEFAQIIYRLMYMKEKNYSVFPLSTDWQTYTHPTDEYSIQFPYGWKQFYAGDQIIFWKQDEGNGQLSWARIFPNSATVIIAVDDNEENLSLDTYVGLLQYGSEATTQKLTLNGYPFQSVTIQSTGLVDYFFQLPNKTFLVAYTQLGDGDNRFYLSEQVRNLIGSMRYHEGPAESGINTEKETFLAQVRQNILVDDKGQETLDMFSDELLIETDSIGIGTGPVDYYYSAAYDITLK
ncbi:MAG TPA: S-layer homology domain-containing protein, partial [Candidatus Gracilibacteria bacterium]|nr:S-layer homology domain-containing protein [Candidatus Gracilibacteria bacterium]